MFGVALSLAEFALVEQQPSVIIAYLDVVQTGR
jgi:hypothetical protein